MPPKSIKKQPTNGIEWVEARLVEPKKFTFTETGDYYSPAINPGETDRTIVPAEVLPASYELILQNYAKKMAEIKETQTILAQARRDLMEVYRNYKNGLMDVTKEDVLTANLQVRDAEQAFICIAYPTRTITEPQERMSIKDLDIDQKHETRKNWDNVYMLQTTSFPWQLSWAIDPSSIAEERRKCEEKMKPPVSAPVMNTTNVAATGNVEGEDEERRRANARRAAIIAARTRAKKSRGGMAGGWHGGERRATFMVQKM